MDLEQKISISILEETDKLIQRYHEYHNRIHVEYIRNKRRLGDLTPNKIIHKPDYWATEKMYNPFYVHRRYKSIAKSIAKKIALRTYTPNKPYIKKIPKSDGGERKVAIYQIPDAAISRMFFNRLLSKNKHRFSSFSYAYRNDRNVHFAIQDISVDLKDNERTFIAEFDFSDFFGSISHEFLFQQFSKNGFFISPEEQYIIKAFLKDRNVGIPQGTSISLFLANLTCWSLDQRLEKEGVKFSRYADDTIIWSPEYSKICNSYQIINKFSKEAGININPTKSEGINLLTKSGLPSEISAKNCINFLGYSLSVNKISIKEKSINNIKKQISYILYRNLIQPLKKDSLAGQVIPANDMDRGFLVAIMQVRRYIYGGLSNKQMKDFLTGRTKRIYFKGVMSFYPLVDDLEQLKMLDGWLLSIIHRSLKLRNKLFIEWKQGRGNIFPFNQTKNDLLKRCEIENVNGMKLFEIPSFLLIQKALQKGLIESGIEKIMNLDSLDYDY